jgi:hypothetical protein
VITPHFVLITISRSQICPAICQLQLSRLAIFTTLFLYPVLACYFDGKDLDYQQQRMMAPPPFARELDFVGREVTLRKLQAILGQESSCKSRRAALVGVGGIG